MKKWKAGPRKDELHALWRECLRKRDKDTCQWCLKAVKGSNSQPHHIVAVSICGNAGRYEVENGMILCYHCHIDRLKAWPDEYIKFRDLWLQGRCMFYTDLRIKYKQATIKFTPIFFEEKKSYLQIILKNMGGSDGEVY